MEKSVRELAKESGVSVVTYYKRLKEVYEKEGKYRELTQEELKRRKDGRPRKYVL